MKKKFTTTSKDKEDWINFTKQIYNPEIKKEDFLYQSKKTTKIPKLDLHGYSLLEANKEVKKFIINSFNKDYRKILIVTGKGTRSKAQENPYISQDMSILKYSVPNYINSDNNLKIKISRISEAELKDGGSGAINVFLKKRFRE